MPNFAFSDQIIPFTFTSILFPKSIIAQFIHDRVFELRRSLLIDSKSFINIVSFFYMGKNVACNSDHPNELIYIISRKSASASEENHHVVDFEVSENLVGFVFVGGEDFSDCGDVFEVPGVVVYYGCTVWEARYLIPVVPPRENFWVFGRIFPQPVVSVSEIVDNVLLPGLEISISQHYRRRRVNFCPYNRPMAHKSENQPPQKRQKHCKVRYLKNTEFFFHWMN